ncbi:Hypothetical_protein [Hexamita inflata]|uniref:Hypothetical_protein n=1 Tax=Hexamita inflata TaxID=28002 RepID=A0AA86N8D4_9EUKA|nr:Hypothetical protein HINF_LOCUS2514 [Hexamita inflata]
MSVLMRRENTLIIEPGSDISKIQIINFILLPNSKKHFEGPPLQFKSVQFNLIEQVASTAKTRIWFARFPFSGTSRTFLGTSERVFRNIQLVNSLIKEFHHVELPYK